VALMRGAVVVTRGQVAQFASYIGVGALLAGIVGVLWQGGINVLVVALFGIAIAGIGVWAAATPADFINVITGRKVRYSTFAVFSTMLLVAVVATVFLYLQRSALTLDMTQAQRFSLTDASLNLLQRVARPIQITGFYSARNLPQREIDDQFFRLYSAANSLITRVYIDPDEQPAVAQRYGVSEDGQVFIAYLNDDGAVDFETLARVPRGYYQERDLSGAVARLLVAGSVTVYLDQSLGERDPNDSGQEGVSGINGGMRESGVVTRALLLTQLAEQNADIPADASAVLMVRPLVDLTDAQIAVLDRYLSRGGGLLLLVDPLFNQAPFLQQDGAFNRYLWDNFGIRALDLIVVDAEASGQTALDLIGANVNTGTDISARLNPTENPLLFRTARAVDVDIERTIPDVANGRIVVSSNFSYGETDWTALSQTNSYRYDDGVDTRGPLTTVVWAANQRTGGRIVLIGDSDFVSNGLVLTAPGNGILFTDALTWLTRFEEELDFGISGFSVGLPLIFVDFRTLDLIAFGTIIVLPAAVLLFGLLIWTRRARRR
jgi:ABC-type uncharacterized transport system involved in gliding motility auxiliary subunit